MAGSPVPGSLTALLGAAAAPEAFMLQRWAASARAPTPPSRRPGAAAPRPARRPRCTPTPPSAPAQALRAPVRPGHGLLGMQGAAEGARGDRGAGIPQRGRGARRGPGGEAAVVQGPSPATEARLARLTRRGSPEGRCTHRRSEPRGNMEGAVVPCLSSAGPLEPHMRSEADRLLPAELCREPRWTASISDQESGADIWAVDCRAAGRSC